MSDIDWMRLAIEKAREAIASGQMPIGAVIVKEGRLIASAHNTVWRDGDPTAHAEMNGIRIAARSLGDVRLSGCTVYSTLEPCPMCLGAIHWARIERAVFGAPIADAVTAGFGEMPIPAKTMAELGHTTIQVKGGILLEECAALFEEWKRTGRAKPY
jgi:tRNA(adenine34) deaminase